MLSNKYTRAFFKSVEYSNFSHSIGDLNSIYNSWNHIINFRLDFENNISNLLLSLSYKQRIYLLLQLLTDFKFNSNLSSFDYLIEGNESALSKEADYFWTQLNIHRLNIEDDYIINNETGDLGEKTNLALHYFSGRTLLRYVIGHELSRARNNIHNTYRYEKSTRTNSRAGKETLALITNLSNILPENPEDVELVDWDNKKDKTNTPLNWSYSIPDFAEMLYKLERKGAIDLKSYFNSGGSGAELSRLLSQVFTFTTASGKPAAILNSYISEIKKSLGSGPLDAGVLKAIGRIRGGKMDDVLPDEPEPNTP
jgi:hypothetical protein